MVRKEKKTALNARVPFNVKARVHEVATEEGQSDSGMVNRIVEWGLYLIDQFGSWGAVMEAEISLPARSGKKIAARPASRRRGDRQKAERKGE